jgi:hypothetical protein
VLPVALSGFVGLVVIVHFLERILLLLLLPTAVGHWLLLLVLVLVATAEVLLLVRLVCVFLLLLLVRLAVAMARISASVPQINIHNWIIVVLLLGRVLVSVGVSSIRLLLVRVVGCTQGYISINFNLTISGLLVFAVLFVVVKKLSLHL